MPNFESFSRRLLPLRSEPHVTIQRRGSMSLNQSAHAAIGSPDSVELLYDRQLAIIGLRAIDAGAENAYVVRRSSRSAGGPWVVSAMAFTKFYGIDTSTTLRWAAYVENGVLCVNLRQPPTPLAAAPPSTPEGR